MSALDLDHVGIAAHNLDAAAEQFRRLGFQLTARGYHTLPPATPGGERPRVGTGNNCAMLARGYIELIGIVDPGYAGRLWDDLARYEGLHIVAFGTPDAAATTEALRRAGIPAADARVLERPIEQDGRTDLARFEIVDFGDAQPGFYSFAIHHATPELLWKPALLQHPNASTSLEAVTIAVTDMREFAARLGRIVGTGETGTGVVKLEAGAVRIVDGEWLAAHIPGNAAAPPVVAAMTIGSSDIEKTAAWLRQSGIAFERTEESILVEAADGCGALIEFVAV